MQKSDLKQQIAELLAEVRRLSDRIDVLEARPQPIVFTPFPNRPEDNQTRPWINPFPNVWTSETAKQPAYEGRPVILCDS